MTCAPATELLELLPPDTGHVLVLGGGRSAVSEALRRAGHRTEPIVGDWPTIQRPARHDVVVVESLVGDEAAIVHCAVQHLRPGGHVVVVIGAGPTDGDIAERFELAPIAEVGVEDTDVAVFRRSARRTIHDVVFEARSRIRRTSAAELAACLADSERPPLVVDTRTATDRSRFGVIAGSIHVPRTVLEWHLDPANGYRHPAVRSFDQPIVVVCNGGYSSSLAAASLLDLGFGDVGDLVGGVRAWTGAGLPVVEPDHTHLDL